MDLFNLLILSCFVAVVSCNDDILGCGGYVKSDVEINYSQVVIKLYTQQGILKYETESAPNNGYYFIPLYDKGDYILKVAPPSGWTFQPQEVSLKVDGETDSCSLGHDINFHFQGFAVIGKVVTAGSEDGPAGVNVALFKGDKMVSSTVTTEGGGYVFTPLSSGTYKVKASHTSWKLLSDTATVIVIDKNGDAGKAISIAGYTLSGRIISDGDLNADIGFILLSHGMPDIAVDCSKEFPETFGGELSALCYTVANKKGVFTFPNIPYGNYVIRPVFSSEMTKYEVTPESMEVHIEHDDFILDEDFKVEGFSIHGQVLLSANGPPVTSGSVVLNDKDETSLDLQGRFSFFGVKPGISAINVYSKQVLFEKSIYNISSSNPDLGIIIPSQYEVCFSVVAETMVHPSSWQIEILSSNNQNIIETNEEGNVCIMLLVGTYIASVKLSPDENKAGIRFGPLKYTFEVKDKPIQMLSFSQFLGEISGKIHCLKKKCPEIEVGLSGETDGELRRVTAKEGKFVFKEVIPGSYKVNVQKDDWCWKARSFAVTLNTQNIDVAFVQEGFQMTIASSHEASLNYRIESGVSGTINIPKGTTRTCLYEEGIYSLTAYGCHRFSDMPILWNTSSLNLITLAASYHKVTGTILSDDKAVFTVTAKMGDAIEVLSVSPPVDGSNKYSFEYWATQGEKLTLIPNSESRMYHFHPSSFSVTMPNDCLMNAVTFQTERALFISGKVVPPLEGVTIIIEGAGETFELSTDKNGSYSAGPLSNQIRYAVRAEKKGYVFSSLPEEGSFEVYKLAEIIVKVIDEDSNPLSGVLISTSGGENYRQNSLTEPDGLKVFESLMPGEYFLRPMMKEYSFHPSSKMVTLEEGSSVVVTVSGHRIAFSLFGETVSLNGEPEADVVLEMVGKGPDCEQNQEETTSDLQGQFRIRGLIPGCEYDLQLKKGESINRHIERMFPATRSVKMTSEDVSNVRLILLRPFPQMDLAVKVETDPKYLSTLSAQLYRDDLPDSPVHVVKFVNHPYLMLPVMTVDRRSYTLRLSSSLSSSQYKYSLPEVSFIANKNFMHFDMKFEPKMKSLDAEMSQGTVIGLTLGLLFLIIIFNYDKCAPSIQKLMESFLCAKAALIGGGTESVTMEHTFKKKSKARKVV